MQNGFKNPEVTYDFSSLNIDYFSPGIFKYMDFGEKVGVRINLILKNNKLTSFDFDSIPSTVSSIDLSNNNFAGKLNMSFINKIQPIKINLNNNLSSIDYHEIKKYIKTSNNKSKVSSIYVFLDLQNAWLWENKGAWSPKDNKLKLLLWNNKINKLEFQKNIKLINKI